MQAMKQSMDTAIKLKQISKSQNIQKQYLNLQNNYINKKQT